jgi:hypothetical protein
MTRSARHVLWIAGGCGARTDAYCLLAQPQVTYPDETLWTQPTLSFLIGPNADGNR